MKKHRIAVLANGGEYVFFVKSDSAQSAVDLLAKKMKPEHLKGAVFLSMDGKLFPSR